MTKTAPGADLGPESHHTRPYRRLIVAADLVTDQALSDIGGDQFHHAAIAKAVADLTLSAAAPANIALFGPWGSGKSTFYNLMKSRVVQQDRHVELVHYDAWKYGGQALKRNFIQDVARQQGLSSSEFDRDLTLNQEQSRIRLGRWFRYNWPSLLVALVIGLAVASLWTCAHAAIDAKWVHPSQDFWEALPNNVNGFGLVLAAVLTALMLGPKALESAVVKTTRPAIDRDDQFARMFGKLIDQIKKQNGARRVVFFIDELDRCEPDDVVATLVDLKTFLDEPDCIFVVAADRDVLEYALRKVPQAKPIREDDPYYSTPGAFIDKIFQHQVALPPLRSHALSSFAHQLVSGRSHGLWRDLEAADPTGRLFDDVVYILVPAHVSSPRRVKVLLNNFATSARIAESRHIDWIVRARELAFLTVLETEFPTVSATLMQFPELLAYLRKEKDPEDLPGDRKAQIERLTNTGAGSSVAGKIVRDGEDATEDGRETLARQELARQLADYLGKLVVISDLHDPRPDLFYLRVVGYDEGLTDPNLGEMIDLAAERQPDVVVAAFENEPPEIKALAATLLIKDLSHQRGTGQANVLESACRLVQQLPAALVTDTAHLAPEILSHVGRSAWRLNSIPGAVYLAVAQAHAADQVGTLMALLSPAQPDNDSLLEASIPALAWTDDDAASHIHAKVVSFLPTTTGPLATGLSALPADRAQRLYDAAESAIGEVYDRGQGPASLALFNTVIDAILENPDPEDLLWSAISTALTKSVAVLAERIHERRDDLLPLLTAEDRACAALFEIEVGDVARWTDWIVFLSESELERTEHLSLYARDAAKTIVKQIPATTDDLIEVIEKVGPLIHEAHKSSVLDAVVEQIPTINWGDDPDSRRWTNLQTMVQYASTGVEDTDAVADAIAASLLTSISARLSAPASTITVELVDDWRARISELPAQHCKDLDAELARLAPPSTTVQVVLLRLRIAARLCGNAGSLPAATLIAVASDPSAGAMAAEWLAFRPSVSSVVQVHAAIPLAIGPLGQYAASLKSDRRTALWIALEKSGASGQHLRAAGKAGVGGEAISHMSPSILNPTQQRQRDVAAARLLRATFAEEPTRAELGRGETAGHKAASQLALDLISTGINDNVILAARIIIHSGGCAYGTKDKLRKAFTNFADGKQSRNFTKAQATDLQSLGVLAPAKKGRWASLLDKVKAGT